MTIECSVVINALSLMSVPRVLNLICNFVGLFFIFCAVPFSAGMAVDVVQAMQALPYRSADARNSAPFPKNGLPYGAVNRQAWIREIVPLAATNVRIMR
ncbi:MAG: hypothetical protein ACOYKQ_07400 [Polymorphobacter sp.]